MRIAVAVGDFTPGEANELRKNIGAWNMKEFERNLNPWREKLKNGMKRNGFKQTFIDEILGQMSGFAHYGFPESHAVSFALIAYTSSYLKCHYPAAFFNAILNSQPMGFYSPHALLQAAKRDGVKILPVSINHSHWDNTLEQVSRSNRPKLYGIRLGFRLVKSLSRDSADEIMRVRQPIECWTGFDQDETEVVRSVLASSLSVLDCKSMRGFTACKKSKLTLTVTLRSNVLCAIKTHTSDVTTNKLFYGSVHFFDLKTLRLCVPS